MTDACRLYIYYYPGEQGQECGSCVERFTDHRSWSRHVEVRHAGSERAYICERCGGRFASILSVANHYVHCLKRRPIRSPIRVVVETTIPVVGTPLRILNEETGSEETRLLCPECGRQFESKAGVSLHLPHLLRTIIACQH